MIPYAGKYNLQLRATQGDKVRHTNIVQMQVNDSMSGDEVWPELPSEFSQAEQRITELNEHPPKPGDNGFWLIWNVETDQYEPSDIPLPSGGGSGSAGGYYTPEVTQSSDNTMQVSFTASEDNMPPVEPVSVTLPAGPAGRDGEDGTPGLPGQDGFSPTVQTEPIEGGTKVTITDATGPKEFEVMDGTNGQDGQPGRDGAPGAPGTPGRDGYSPIVQTAAIDGGTRVTITDADGPKTFDVLNGTNGEDGEPGQDGAPGQDGFSPTASVTQTEDGAKITITDKSGTTNATITNGKDGTNGTDGADGQTPNITPGNIETLPAGSDVTASITGQTPNLVLNLGIPQGPAGAGIPPTDTAQAGDVPTWDGEQVVWAEQSGGGEYKVNRIDVSEEMLGNAWTEFQFDIKCNSVAVVAKNIKYSGYVYIKMSNKLGNTEVRKFWPPTNKYVYIGIKSLDGISPFTCALFSDGATFGADGYDPEGVAIGDITSITIGVSVGFTEQCSFYLITS